MTEQQAHHDREHMQWAASSGAANMKCAGRIAMETISPEEKESEYAAWGTAGHEISDNCLRNNKQPSEFLGSIVKTKSFEIEVDEEMVNTVDEYVEYVRSLPGELLIEQKFSLAAIDPPFPAGGTCDALLIDLRGRIVRAVDFKGGRGAVEVVGNDQLRHYLLGALLSLPKETLAQIDDLEITIVQPRVAHKDGRIRSEKFTVADIVEWSSTLVKAMRRSKQALDEFMVLDVFGPGFLAWAEKWLTPGACTFCRARGPLCPAYNKKALATIGEKAVKWYEDPDAPLVVPAANELSPERLEHILDGLEHLEDWIKSVRATAHAQAEHGVKFDHWILVDKIGNRAWKDEVKASEKLAALGLTEKQMHVSKFVSPAQADKLLGKRKGEIEDLWEKPVKGTNLASVAKTTRPAAKNKIEQHFEQIEKE